MNTVKPLNSKVIHNNPNPGCSKCETAMCATCPKNAIKDVPEVANYSRAKRAALALLGPKARIWRGDIGPDGTMKDPLVMVGFEMNPGRLVLGFGDTFQEALEAAVEKNRS